MEDKVPVEDQGRGPFRSISRGNPPPSGVVDDYPPTRLPDPSPPCPNFAGRYVILRELGRGGMGVVWHARDTRLPRDVAIKAPLYLRDPDTLRRFFKEAEAAAQLDHPNIGRILDLGEADGLPFIVLAFIPGRTLAQVLGRRTLRPSRAAKIARGVARTVQFAHEQGVIHRDLKPSNLMIGPHRELIVLDFGLARLEGEERKTLTGQVFGTPAYMSPEQVQGLAREMGRGCDIYALGVILYELLTGQLPFRGPLWELPSLIVRGDPVAPSRLAPDIGPGLDAIVLKAMDRRIDGRFASMAEFADALAAYLRGIGSSSSSDLNARPWTGPTGGQLSAFDFPVRLSREPLREVERRGRFGALDGLIWGAIVLLGLAVAYLFGEAEPNPAPTLGATPTAESAVKPRPPVRPRGGSQFPAKAVHN